MILIKKSKFFKIICKINKFYLILQINSKKHDLILIKLDLNIHFFL